MAQKFFTITLDLLNDGPFLDAMQLAIDAANSAERLLQNKGVAESPEGCVLSESVNRFRDWFRKGPQ